MNCDRAKVLNILERIADRIEEEKTCLTELDTKIGDADHGLSMSRGFQAVKEKLPGFGNQCIGTILKSVGMTLVSTVGGASGPLYGTAFMYAGNEVVGKQTLDRTDAARMAKAALDGIVKRGRAASGEKTMLDTLIPVAEYLNSPEAESRSAEEMLRTVEALAREGMESTRPLLATKGRASFLKERSIGHLDPGAVSAYIIIQTIVQALQEEV